MKIETLSRYGLLATLALALEGAGLLIIGSGCATFSEAIPQLTIQALGSNRFLVENREVSQQALPRAMNRAGANEETEIHIQMAPGQTPSSLAATYAALQKAGFYKLLFVTRREATATIVEPAAPTRSLSPSGPKKRP